MITGVDHVQLAMPPGGEGEARGSFAVRGSFAGVLGMGEEVKPERLAVRGGCWFAAGSCKLHLGVEEDFAPQRLESAGHAVRWDEALPDRRRFYVHDPFGNRIEVMQVGDGFRSGDRAGVRGTRCGRRRGGR